MRTFNVKAFFQSKYLVYIKIIFLLFFFAFIIKGQMLLDPDFGWHLRMGEVISRSGIPATDPFSYTMPSYPFVDHEWLTNFLIAKLYPILGLFGLSIIFSVIFFSTLYITVSGPLLNSFKRKETALLFTKILLTLLSLAIFIPYFGVRPQVLSWFFLAWVLRLILQKRAWLRWRFLVPLIFLFWTNLHGSFSLGIIVLSIIIIFKFLRTKIFDRKDILVAFFCLLATFINPYKERVWWEVWMQFTDTTLHWRILEWRPMFSTFHTSFLILLTLTMVLVFKYRDKFALEEKLLFLFFLFQAVTTLRHIPLWTIIGLLYLFKSMGYFYEDIKKVKFGLKRYEIANKILLIGIVTAVFSDFGFSFYDASYVNEKYFYPKEAIKYLKSKNYKAQIFSYYGWGGYLIWKLPEKKVFIDGRMPSWRWNANAKNESNYAMEEYLMISEGKIDINEEFSKYKVGVVLWPKERDKTILDILSKGLKSRIYQVFSKDISEFDFLTEIENMGWSRVYEDNIAFIYEKS